MRKIYQYPGFCVRFALASLAGCGMGNNSPLPVINPVANLPTGEFVPVALMALVSQFTLVVPDGVEVGAVLYNEFLYILPML